MHYTYDYDNIKLINADCMHHLHTYPDNYFDLGVLDPPYGINIAKGRTIGKRGKSYSSTKYTPSEWDSNIPNAEYFMQVQRICKHVIIWGGNYFTEHLPATKSWLIWAKNQPEGISFAMGEMAWTNLPTGLQIFNYSIHRAKNCVSNNRRKATKMAKIVHTQKPLALYAWIFRRFAKPGAKVLDTHGGSFSSAIVATRCNFAEFVGYEIDENIYALGLNRFKQQMKQLTLQL